MQNGTQKRRTQQERREETRRALLDATVACLTELGYARTTTLEVQKRAGVSRGALLHHFPSKAELMTAAIEHLARLRGVELTARAKRLPQGKQRTRAAVEMLWEQFSGPLFHVSMELRNAARTDPELRAVLQPTERELAKEIFRFARELFGPTVASRQGFDHALDLVLDLMMGAAMKAVLHPRVRTDALLARCGCLFDGLSNDDSTLQLGRVTAS